MEDEEVMAGGDPPDEDAEAAVEVRAQAERDAEAQAQAERDALMAVFDDVRGQSADSALVEPTRWPEIGLVPDHLTADQFEMFVYEYVESAHARDDAGEEGEAKSTPVVRSATRAVGVPPAIGAPSDTTRSARLEEDVVEPGASVADMMAESPSVPGSGPGEISRNDLDIPDGFELVEIEGQMTMVPLEEPEGTEPTVDCGDIAVLRGRHSYYLYSRDLMTDAYAHWSFLAREDDKVVSFVDCVRDESRTYPRPMAAAGFKNEPFMMTDQDIERTWEIVEASGEYPDIERTAASNGAIYFFSTNYLSRRYARSLAEWHAVERAMYL